MDVYQLGIAGFGLVLMLSGSKSGPKVFGFWAGILGVSAVILASLDYGYGVLLKQGVVAACVYTGVAVLLERTTPGTLVKSYMNVCFGAAVFGLVQLTLSFAGIRVLMKVSGRLDSFAYEPSHYAIAIAPAAYLSLRALFRQSSSRPVRELTILASMLGTVSFTALIVLFASSVIVGVRDRGPFLALMMVGLGFVLYANQDLLPEDIRARLEAIEVNADDKVESVSEIKNLSLFSAMSNWDVAVDTAKRGRILGNGFGGHEGAYSEYFGDMVSELGYRYGFNVKAGHSLFIRVFSEFGFLGMFVYVWWLVRGVRWASEPRRMWWTLSAVYLLGRIFKLGGYFDVGMPVFMVAPIVFYGRVALPGDRMGSGIGKARRAIGDRDVPDARENVPFGAANPRRRVAR